MPAPESRTATAPLAERYRVLLEIGHTLTGTLDADDLYRVLYRETVQVIDASGFHVSLYDEATGDATLVFYADGTEERNAAVRYPGSDSEAIRTGRGVIHPDRASARSLLLVNDGVRDVQAGSAISAPLRYKGRTIGALSAHHERSEAYSDEDLELLQGIADVAAVAVENARFVAELEHRRREAEEIEEIGRALTSSLDTEEVMAKVAQAVLRVMSEVDGATVWLLDGTVARVAASVGSVSLPIGTRWDVRGPIHERLVTERESVVVADLATPGLIPEGLRDYLAGGSGLAVPLVVSNEVAGALSAGSRAPRAFDPENVRVLTRIARQAAVALENARLHASLHSLSLTDPLTGLPNRRHLQMHMEREVAAARRGRELVLVMFDLDNFKVYNDAAGHLAGDEALRAFATCLAEENRAMNLVARYGGDEFVSVLSDTTREGAAEFVSRVRDRMETREVLHENAITVSTGIARFDPDTMGTMGDLIEAADGQMYQDKGERTEDGR